MKASLHPSLRRGVVRLLGPGLCLVACSSSGPRVDEQRAYDPVMDAKSDSGVDRDSGTVEDGALESGSTSNDAASDAEHAADADSVEAGSVGAGSVDAVDAAGSESAPPHSVVDTGVPSSQPLSSQTPTDASAAGSVIPQPSASGTAPPPERHATCGSGLSAEPVGVNGDVSSTVTGADGTLYLAGAFSIAGPVTGGGVPFDTAIGEPLPSFPKVAGVVYAVVADGAGGWFIGGEFTHVGTLPRNNLAHITVEQQVDNTWVADTDDAVRALALDADTLYVGGEFTILGGELRHGLGALDPSANVTEWAPEPQQLATSSNDTSDVRALLFDQGRLYVGGHFNQIAGQSRHNLVSFTSDGILTSWDPIVSWPFFESDVGTVQAIASAGDFLYVGGHFDVVSGEERNGLARFDADGELSDWDPQFYVVSQVNAMTVAGDVLYVGGSFGGPEATPRTNLAAFDMAGAITDWVPQVNARVVLALAAIHDTIYVAGEPPTPPGSINAATFGGTLAAVDTAGNLLPWEPFTDSIVYALAAQQDVLYVGGRMRTMCGESRKYLAALDAQGKLSPWHPDADYYVNSIAIQDDVIYAGGAFGHVAGQARNKLAAIDTAGAVTAWNPRVDSLGIVSTLVMHHGYIAVGGSFSTVGGNLQSNLTLLDTDGTIIPWDISTTGDVYSLASVNDTLYVAGAFAQIGAQSRSGLAAIAPDGSVADWAPEPDATVYSLATDGSLLYVGGEFTSIAGAVRGGVAAFDAQSVLLPWNPGTAFGPDSYVWQAAATPSAVYLIGSFPDILGSNREGVIAIGTDGTLSAWDPAPNPGASTINATSTAICIAGGFTFIAGQHVAGVACLEP